MTKWHSGPPPSMGWWPCKIRGWPDRGSLRWWNGIFWSWPTFSDDSAKDAALWAGRPGEVGDRLIQWTARPESWPKRSKT